MGDALGTKVNADWVNEGVGEEVREGEDEVGVGHGCDIWVLAEVQEDGGHAEPEQRNGQRRNDEEDDGAVKGQREELWTLGSEGLGTERLHAQGQAGEDRVAGDVGEGDGQRPGGELEVPEAAEEEHGDD